MLMHHFFSFDFFATYLSLSAGISIWIAAYFLTGVKPLSFSLTSVPF